MEICSIQWNEEGSVANTVIVHREPHDPILLYRITFKRNIHILVDQFIYKYIYIYIYIGKSVYMNALIMANILLKYVLPLVIIFCRFVVIIMYRWVIGVCGLLKSNNIPVSHCKPVHPAIQKHKKYPSIFLQVPPL